MPRCEHHNPDSFVFAGTSDYDDRRRMICPNCRKFIGYGRNEAQRKALKKKEAEAELWLVEKEERQMEFEDGHSATIQHDDTDA